MRFLALLLAAVMTACGGGGGSAPVIGTITPAAPPRTDLLFGYFAETADYIQEVRGHTNLAFPWTDGAHAMDQLAALTQAKGMKTIVSVPLCLIPIAQAESEARTWLQRIHDVGLLGDAVAVYWCDEPDTVRSGLWSDDGANAMNAAVRKAMATFPELHAKLAVIYACDTGRTPGFASYDWIGCDHYPSGCGVFAKYVEPLRARLTASQRLLIVPGGADPWRQDPACFENYANAHSEVVAVITFLWQDTMDAGVTYTGIRNNPTKALYVEMGKRITG